jgi:hypothetical protein
MNDYTPINKIEDIDVRQISIHEINRKYIDRNGNRFATRFNPGLRRIEIVRIASNKDEAQKIRNQILKQRIRTLTQKTGTTYESEPVRREYSYQPPINNIPEPAGTGYESITPTPAATSSSTFTPAQPGKSLYDFDDDADPYSNDLHFAHTQTVAQENEGFTNESEFLEECMKDFHRVRDRQNAILNHIKKSRVFEKKLSEKVTEILREIDVECWQRSEKAVNYYRELYSYPRPVNYYVSKLPDDKKKKAESMSDDSKLDYIRRCEMQRILDETYRRIIQVSEKLYQILWSVKDDEIRTLAAQAQQSIKDARTGCDLLLEESTKRLDMIEHWKRKFS